MSKRSNAQKQNRLKRGKPALTGLGRHKHCGGIVELCEYAFVCFKCGAQDWHEDSGGHYVPDLQKQVRWKAR